MDERDNDKSREVADSPAPPNVDVPTPPATRTALDMFGSDLSDDVFEGVFDTSLRRDAKWRSFEV